MDRSGYARGTLAPRAGMSTEVPPLDPRALLTMTDMGMSHSEGHGARGDSGRNAQHGDGAHADAHGAEVPAGHDTQHTETVHAQAADRSVSADTQASEHSAMSHSMPMPATAGAAPNHAATESNPNVDMQVAQASPRLDDPGVGLRDNGRRVLTYSDLHTLGGPIDARPPGRDIELHLTGHMPRFIWSFNGQKFSEAEPLRFTHGERLRIVLVNDSMMHHPIHLHGMWSELEDESGAFLVRKHTVTVQPAQRVSYLVTADALGRWAYHCHLLYHMEAGMFREVVVAHEGPHSEHQS
jgi:CopA family copper-resistance protein